MEHIPAYFIVSKDDYVTQATEVTKLYETYACTKKKLAKVSGLHHSFRQTYELANAAEFLHNIEEAIKDESILNNLLYDKIKIYHDFSYEGLDVADENVIINDTRQSIKGKIKKVMTRDELDRQIEMREKGLILGTDQLNFEPDNLETEYF